MSDLVQRDALAAFLRSRRDAIDPGSVGLPSGPRRRTPGLRREEVAQLSGLSTTWYAWLEQGRRISVSRQVLASLARALRLTPAERAHLFTLAGLRVPSEGSGRSDVDDTLRRLVDALDPSPAYVVNPWWDLLAYNRTYASLLGLPHQPRYQPSPGPNTLWLMFTDDHLRDV